MSLFESIEEQTGRIRLLTQKLENKTAKVCWIFGAGLAYGIFITEWIWTWQQVWQNVDISQ